MIPFSASTVISIVPVLPSAVVPVIVTVPAVTPVTTPSATVATASSLDSHVVTVSDGVKVAVPPTVIVVLSAVIVILFVEGVSATVTSYVPVTPEPSAAVAVTVIFAPVIAPEPIVNTPSELSLILFSLSSLSTDKSHVTFLFVASSGVIFAVNVNTSPFATVPLFSTVVPSSFSAVTVIPVTATGASIVYSKNITSVAVAEVIVTLSPVANLADASLTVPSESVTSNSTSSISVFSPFLTLKLVLLISATVASFGTLIVVLSTV